MSAVAKLLLESGWKVTGSDEGMYPPVSDYLRDLGIPCSVGYRPENIPADADIIVVGKHARLVPEENAEVHAAMESGKPVRSFPDVLNDLTRESKNLVVVGSFGKSTVTSMVTWCLVDSGRDPSYFIGALPLGLPSNAHRGADPMFVLEGDEYPSSNWDCSSKFLHYNARAVLLTSGEHDHVNVFPSLDDYLVPYVELLKSLPDEGVVVACADGANVDRILRDSGRTAVSYGLDAADWTARDIRFGEVTRFDLVRDGRTMARLETQMLGRHNVQNCVGAAALLLETGLLTVLELQQSMARFVGVRRRLDRKAENSVVPVYEGFGSSLAKARAAIEAMRLHFPDRRLLVVFEPHTFSWRNRQALPWYDTLFDDVGTAFIYHPPTHGASTHEQLSLEAIVARAQGAGACAEGCQAPDELLNRLREEVRPTDAILILTSGSLDGAVDRIGPLVEALYPKPA